LVGKRHQKRLDRIARRKKARAAQARTQYRVGDKGTVHGFGFVEGSEAHLVNLGLHMSEEGKVEIVVLQEPETKGEIQFDRAMYDRLKTRYDDAVTNNEEQFVFEGFEFLRDYVKYMLEFLDDKLV